jgi:ribose transport system permease protein
LEAKRLDLRSILKNQSLLIVLLVLIIFFAALSNKFLSYYNLINILKRITITGIISLGTLFVIITGGIDVSVGAVAALASIITAVFIRDHSSSIVLLLLLIATAAVVGLLLGIIISKARVPPIITTLAFMSIVRGAMMIYTNGFTIENVPHPLLAAISRGKLLSIPVLVLLLIVLYIASGIVLKKTRFGRYIFAVGGNEEVARQCGIKVNAVKIGVYLFAAFMSVAAGLVMCARLNVGQPTAAMGIELDCIAAVVLGGASLSGGKGSVYKTFLGVLILGLLINGLNYLNVVTYYQYVIQGSVILISTLMYSKRK